MKVIVSLIKFVLFVVTVVIEHGLLTLLEIVKRIKQAVQ